MSRAIKVFSGTEAQMGNIRSVIDRVLGFPKKGAHIGGGRHCDMPDTWDGTGPTPPGWAKSATIPWVTSATDAVLPLTDDIAALLQDSGVQSKLTSQEKTTLANAIAARISVILDGRTPKE